MSRRDARKHIFNLVFQTEFCQEINADDILNTYIEEYEDFPKGESDFIEKEYRGVVENIEDIDSYINKFAIGWSSDRLAKTDLAILRMGIYEIVFDSEIPNAVAVNEAVELSKSFSEDKAPSFINAILVKIVKSREE